ncbi:MAG: hypothetical protein JRI68_34155, partial [Deltaproteobacteria bacterium]|nr:hypothetical protein [Deltaproteobacteria bacterium]
MYGWTFAARTIEEVGAVLRAMGKHRYLAEVDLRLHWAVDAALVETDERFAAAAARFKQQRKVQPDLDLRSRDPGLWRAAEVDEVIAVLDAFWNPEGRRHDLGQRLRSVLGASGIDRPDHRPFETDDDEPPHPELVLLDWELLPVDELDTERHAGALRAMADSGEEVDPSEPVYLEG